MSDTPAEYVGNHCPWCHEDFENPVTCFDEPVSWGMVGTTIGHNRQLDANGVTDLVGIMFLARYEAEDSDDGHPGVFMGSLWMTPDAARQVGHHLLEQTTPERLAEVAAMTKFKSRVLELCQDPELDLDDDEFVAALANLTSSMLQRAINKKHNLRSPGD